MAEQTVTIEGLEKAYALTGLPEPALAPIKSKVNEAISLIVANNKRIASINAAKAQDPNNVEYLDSLWKANEADPKVSKDAKEFYAVAETYERLLKKLRETAKENFIPEQLSEQAAKDAKKLVNESVATISTARAEAIAMLSVVDSILESQGKGIEGGVASLLPQADSLKNARGRKAASSGGNVTYMTRIADCTVNGKSTKNAEGKGKFNYAADAISELWGAETNAANRVTGEELEEAFFDFIKKPLRSLSEKEVPASTVFDFTKEIDNGDGKTETKTVKLNVIGKVAEAETKTETEKPAEAKPEAEKVEAKNETPAQPAKVEPAKKTAAPAQAKKA